MARYMTTSRKKVARPSAATSPPAFASSSAVASPPAVATTIPEQPFPFMSLSPEIRLMVYDAAMPEQLEIHLTGTQGFPGISPTIRALMEVNLIRDELIPHLFERYHFQWTLTGREYFNLGRVRDRFKHHAIPRINSLSVHFTGGSSLPRHLYAEHDPLRRFLGWARWRSLRPHLFPWQLKNLTLVEDHGLLPRWQAPHYTADDFSLDASHFLMEVSVVPDLDSLRIVLNDRATDEAIKAFLERCASCEIDGRVGYRRYYAEKVSEWFRLQDNQVIRIDG